MSAADLRLVLLLVLLVFTSAIFAACNDSPTSLSPASQSPSFAAKCGTPPCGKGPGGDKGGKGGETDQNFSLGFDGADVGMETPDSDALDLTNPFTIEGWIKPTQPNRSEPQCLICKWGLSVSASYGIAFESDGRFMMVTHDPGASPDNSKIYSNAALQADVWQHFAFVFDQGQAWFYLNGTLNSSCGGSMGNCWNQGGVRDANVPFLNTPQVTATKLSVGRQNSPEGFVDHEYDGVLDELRFWNVARNAKQIEKNYDKEISPKSKGLVAYWQMNEGRGQVLVDATSNGHDMQLGDSPDADSADPTWALKWESLANLLVANRAAPGESDRSRVFVFAGAFNVNDEINTTQVYDPDTDSWSLGAARDPVKAFNMAAVLSDGIHVVGGFNDAHLDSHDVYDATANSWSTAAPLPVAAHAGVAESVGDKMYVVLKDVLRIYDLATNSWSVGTSRPVSVISPASGVIDGKIYVAGGNFGSPTFTTSDDLHRYDPATDSWETLASMPGEREALGGGAIGGRFCVFGGRLVNPSPTGARFSETFCYDPTTDTWSQGPDMLTPRAELASTELGQAVYALGGRPQNDALQGNVAERLVPDTPFP